MRLPPAARRPRPATLVASVVALGLVVTAVVAAVVLTRSPPGPTGAAPTPSEPSETPAAEVVRWWATSADGRLLHAEQAAAVVDPEGGAAEEVAVTVSLDDADERQQVVGFGGALTESSAAVLDQLPAEQRAEVLRALFDPDDGAGISVLRQPLGASDFALSDYTYDDLPPGSTDPDLTEFDLGRDEQLVLPTLREALAVNSDLTTVLTPWSAPAWMKDSGTLHGGSLLPQWEAAYADYLARAAAAYRAAGVPVSAVTPVNEPLHESAGYPTMPMSAEQQARLVGEHLRPAFDAAGLGEVGVLGYDHNWDDLDYPRALLTGSEGEAFAGIAFHCYAGDPAAQTALRTELPETTIWTTECTSGDWSTGPDALAWAARRMLVGGLANGSSAVLWWNLALDVDHGPTNGGCQDCRGLVTVDPGTGQVAYEPEYWALRQAGAHVERGAVVLGTTVTPAAPGGRVTAVGLRNPDGTHVLLAWNDAAAPTGVRVETAGGSTVVDLPAASLSTLVW